MDRGLDSIRLAAISKSSSHWIVQTTALPRNRRDAQPPVDLRGLCSCGPDLVKDSKPAGHLKLDGMAASGHSSTRAKWPLHRKF